MQNHGCFLAANGREFTRMKTKTGFSRGACPPQTWHERHEKIQFKRKGVNNDNFLNLTCRILGKVLFSQLSSRLRVFALKRPPFSRLDFRKNPANLKLHFESAGRN
jgi:hypothetical protein